MRAFRFAFSALAAWRGVTLAAIASSFGNGCIGIGSYETPRTVEPGKVNVSIQHPVWHVAQGKTHDWYGGNVDVTVGVTERVDVRVQTGAGVPYAARVKAWVLDGPIDLGVSALGAWAPSDVGLGGVAARGLVHAGLNVHPRFAFLAHGGVYWTSHVRIGVDLDNRYPPQLDARGFGPTLGGGFAWKLTRFFSVVPTLTWLRLPGEGGRPLANIYEAGIATVIGWQR
jgi:hypothetical protein